MLAGGGGCASMLDLALTSVKLKDSIDAGNGVAPTARAAPQTQLCASPSMPAGVKRTPSPLSASAASLLTPSDSTPLPMTALLGAVSARAAPGSVSSRLSPANHDQDLVRTCVAPKSRVPSRYVLTSH